MKAYKLYILDLDGTVYRGDEALPHAASVIAALRKRGAQVRFLTNNSGRTRAFYASKLSGMGIPCVASDFYSSASGTAIVCRDRGLSSVFAVGEHGLFDELRAVGVQLVNHASDPALATGQASAVVAGICRQFTYAWMNSAMQQIVGGAVFMATNCDATYPLEDGKFEPGAGSIVASIQTCSGVPPEVIGKPNRLLIDLILRDAGVLASEALAVGDRFDTDIVSGQNAGVDVHLVLTGVQREPVEGVPYSEDLLGLSV